MGSGVALVLGSFLSVVPGVLALNEISGLVASSVSAFLLLIAVIAALVIGITWKNWFPKWQRMRGKVKVPRHVRKMRKLRKVLSSKASAASTLPRSTLGDKDSNAYIQKWNSTSEHYDEMTEVKAKSLEMEEEEEFTIVTHVVENETLNLGPFDKKNETPVYTTTIEPEEFEGTTQDLYAVVNKSKKGQDDTTLSQVSSGIGSAATNGNQSDKRNGDEEIKQETMSFSDNDPSLVMF